MHAWEEFLRAQDKKLGKETVDKWLRSLKVVHFDSANLYCEAKDSIHMLWFEEHVRPLLKTSFVNNNHRPIKVHITIPQGAEQTASKKKDKHIPALILTPDPLDKTATLDNFVAEESNAVLFRFLSELLDTAGTNNPVFLYGASGTGKTHLLMALTAAFIKKGKKALYVRAETFTEHVVSAIRSSQMQPFRNHYREADVLLVDDVHVFARKGATQEEFFHTFNALHTLGHQMIFTAPLSASLLEEIEPRLISRFEWGIALHLEKLTRSDLKKMLQSRSKALNFPLSAPVLDFLIETFPRGAPSLSRALEALILKSHLEKKEALDRSTAEKWLQGLIAAEAQVALTPEKIIETIALIYGIRAEDILGKSHAQEFSFPRQLAMYLCRTQLEMPYAAIGRVFSRDHSTVMTSVKQIESKKQERDSEVSFALVEIERRL